MKFFSFICCRGVLFAIVASVCIFYADCSGGWRYCCCLRIRSRIFCRHYRRCNDHCRRFVVTVLISVVTDVVFVGSIVRIEGLIDFFVSGVTVLTIDSSFTSSYLLIVVVLAVGAVLQVSVLAIVFFFRFCAVAVFKLTEVLAHSLVSFQEMLEVSYCVIL